MTKSLWRIDLTILATQIEVDQVAEKIQRALCPDEDHLGPCPIPWAIESSNDSVFSDTEKQHYSDLLTQPPPT